MILFYILIAITPFLNPPIVWRLVGSTATFKLLGALCAIYALIDIISRGSIPAYFRTCQAWFFAALVVLASISFFTRGYGHFLQNPILIYSDFVAFFFVTIALVHSPKRLRWVLFAAAAGIAYGSVDIIHEWFDGHRFFAGYRSGDSVGDGNYFSTSAALILPFVFLMIFHARKSWEKLFFSSCLLLSLGAIMLTGSRGGTLATAVSFLYVIRHSRRARNLTLVTLLILPLAVFLPASPIHRFLHPNERGINTEEFRLQAWEAGLRMFETHPFFGVGLGNFKILMPKYADPGVEIDTIAHNTYVEYLAELGPAGLFLFVAIAFSAFRSLRRVRRRTRPTGPTSGLYLAALALESGLIGYLVGACFLSAEYEKLLWLAIFLSICLPCLVSPGPRAEQETLVIETVPASSTGQRLHRAVPFYVEGRGSL
jgi:O-antigen ligase